MDLKLSQKMFLNLEEEVKQAQKNGRQIDNLVKQQITILEEVHDNFVAQAKKNANAFFDEIKFDEIRIKQLQSIASLCRKIGLPTDKYDKQIFDIRANRFGAEFVKEKYK